MKANLLQYLAMFLIVVLPACDPQEIDAISPQQQKAPSVTPSPIPVVATGQVDNISNHSASIVGQIIEVGVRPINEYGHTWNILGGSSNKVNVALHGRRLNAGSFSSDLNDLLPGTTYEVKAFAITVVGTAYGESVTFTTGN